MNVFYNIANVDITKELNSRDNVYYYEDYAEGYVIVRNDTTKQYEYICDEGWDINDAHVVCRMLGFPGALDATVRTQYINMYYYYSNHEETVVSLSNVQCNGSETSLSDCPTDVNPTCSTQRIAGVWCKG